LSQLSSLKNYRDARKEYHESIRYSDGMFKFEQTDVEIADCEFDQILYSPKTIISER